MLCWAVFWADNVFHLDLYNFGVSPRTMSGLKGILFSPFIHADFNHIANNSFPVFILSSLIFYFYKPIAWPAILWIFVISGIWLWVGGRNNDHIPNYHFGASTLIYGFSTFLFFSGVFRKHKQLMVVSALVVFLYGSITWGIFPFDRTMSWEGHLFGAISGILVAYNYRKEGPQKQEYHWPEEEIDLEHLDDDVEIAPLSFNKEEYKYDDTFWKQSLDPFQIVYHFKPTVINTIDKKTNSSEVPMNSVIKNNIEIIKIELKDIEQLQAIAKQTFFETFADLNSEENMQKYLENEFNIDKLINELTNPYSEFYFAKINNDVIGYLKINFGVAQTEIKESKSIEVERIYVLKEYHGKDVGQFLYNKALSLAKYKGADYLWLGVWEKNHRAINFYKKNGFVEFNKHIFKLGDDDQTDIMMKLILK